MGRQEFLTARLEYIRDMTLEGESIVNIARAVQLDDMGQVRLLMDRAMELADPKA